VSVVNICAILEPVPVWLRRHSLVKYLLRIFPDSHDQWIEFNKDARAYIDLRDPEARNVFLKRSFEPDFFRIARAVLSDGGVYFDCGANFGLCTFGLLPSMKSATLRCHLFEANPALISYLESSSALFPSVQIKIVQGCLSDHAGASRFQISEQFTGYSHVDSSGSSLVGNIVLDAYVEENRIEKVNFLKIDVEGQELYALKGLDAAFRRRAVEVIYLELATDVLDRYDLLPAQIVRFLENNGFRVFYCRDKDLSEGQSATIRFTRSSLNQLPLIEFKPLTGSLRTDVLAIHEVLIEGNKA
jgi:FkbM family methyltransferase